MYNYMRRYNPFWRIADERIDVEYRTYLKERSEEGGFLEIEKLEAQERVHAIYALLDPKPARRLTAQQFMQSEWARSIVMCEGALCGV